MKNLLVWIVLISTAAVGVATAQTPNEGEYAAKVSLIHSASNVNTCLTGPG